MASHMVNSKKRTTLYIINYKEVQQRVM